MKASLFLGYVLEIKNISGEFPLLPHSNMKVNYQNTEPWQFVNVGYGTIESYFQIRCSKFFGGESFSNGIIPIVDLNNRLHGLWVPENISPINALAMLTEYWKIKMELSTEEFCNWWNFQGIQEAE